MRFTGGRLREPLDAAAERGKPDPEIALAIGLEGDALAVGGPDREAAVTAERYPLHRAAAGEIVRVKHLFPAIVDAESDLFSIGRRTHRPESGRRKVQALDLALTIRNDYFGERAGRHVQTGQIDQRARFRDAEVHPARRSSSGRPHALDQRFSRTGERQPRHVKRDREQAALGPVD